MPVDGIVKIRLAVAPDAAVIEGWIRDLYSRFCTDEFLHPFTPEESGFVPEENCDADGVWYDLGVCHVYYGEGYERGDVLWFTTLAEWLESHIDGCEVWYGHDADSEALKPFGFSERATLLDYYRRVGHEPYLAQFQRGSGRLGVAEASRSTSTKRIEAVAVGVLADPDHGEGWIAFDWFEIPSGGLKIDLDGHCSRGMPVRSGNGLPEFVELRRDAILLRFDTDLARKLELPEEIEIGFRISDGEFAELRRVVDWFNGDGEFGTE